MDAPPQNPYYQLGSQLAASLIRYHAYEAIGLKNIPSDGGALSAINHSFATYDSLLLGAKIYSDTGRYPSGLADRRIFQTPGLSQFFTQIGDREGSPAVAESLLLQGKLVIVSPGGMREAIRSSDEKYQITWNGRFGFVRLAIKTRTPVVIAACPSADDIFTLYPNPITPAVYKYLKLPLPVLRGLGLSLIPRPVKLTHYISKPLQPPPLRHGKDNETDVIEFHARLVQEMRELLRNSQGSRPD